MSNLDSRTKHFALRIIRLFQSLPKSPEAKVIGHQLLRSGTSVGAHYQEATRSRSKAEFISKIEVGLQELAETGYWLDLLVESDIIQKYRLEELRQEAKELTAIFISISKKVKVEK